MDDDVLIPRSYVLAGISNVDVSGSATMVVITTVLSAEYLDGFMADAARAYSLRSVRAVELQDRFMLEGAIATLRRIGINDLARDLRGIAARIGGDVFSAGTGG